MSRTTADLSMHMQRLCYRSPQQRETIDMIALDLRRLRKEAFRRRIFLFFVGVFVGIILANIA